MPTEFKSDLATIQESQRLGTRVNDSSRISGNLFIADPVYIGVNTEATSDTIKLCLLPKGARIIPHLSYVRAHSLAAAITVDVGTTANPDAYASALALSDSILGAAFDNGDNSDAAGTVLGLHNKLDGETWLYATLGATTATDIDTGAQLVFYIAYTLVN